MPGFSRCSWCNGKGCICCDAERAKWEKKEAKRQEEHARRTPDEIRKSLRTLEAIRDGDRSDFGALLFFQMSGGQEIDRAAIDAEIAKEEALLDAEYRRQFPDGPKPIFTARRNNPSDLNLLKSVFGREALESAFGPNGGGMAEIEKRAEDARKTQEGTLS